MASGSVMTTAGIGIAVFLALMTLTFSAAAEGGRTIYVSKLGDNSDGSSWAKAFHTIQAALQAVPDDCTVVGVPGRCVKMEGRRVALASLRHDLLPDPVLERLDELQQEILKAEQDIIRKNCPPGEKNGKIQPESREDSAV